MLRLRLCQLFRLSFINVLVWKPRIRLLILKCRPSLKIVKLKITAKLRCPLQDPELSQHNSCSTFCHGTGGRGWAGGRQMNLLITQRTLRHTDSDFLKTGETNSSLMSLDNLFLVVVNFYPRRNSVLVISWKYPEGWNYLSKRWWLSIYSYWLRVMGVILTLYGVR